MKTKIFEVQFSQYIPDKVAPGKLYISMEYATVVHKCACGCGQEVVTPLSPTDWKLTYDGEGVTLSPSIGNWGYPCRSHYFIHNNEVVWASKISQNLIQRGREIDKRNKELYYNQGEQEKVSDAGIPSDQNSKRCGIVGKIAHLFGFK